MSNLKVPLVILSANTMTRRQVVRVLSASIADVRQELPSLARAEHYVARLDEEEPLPVVVMIDAGTDQACPAARWRAFCDELHDRGIRLLVYGCAPRAGRRAWTWVRRRYGADTYLTRDDGVLQCMRAILNLAHDAGMAL